MSGCITILNKIFEGSPVSVSLWLTFKCNPSVVKIILWVILLFASPNFNKFNMLAISYQSVSGANIVSLEDSEKNGNFWKMNIYTKMMFFGGFFCFVRFLIFFFFFFFFFFFCQNIWKFPFLVKTMIYPKHNLANSTFLEVKDTQIWPEKEVNS